ncbi:hypothetical protein [Bryobacter aggregatus]|uniref:hypothetical protein n=1 Tax=Bryobacter aggregatus TaxID=360054 RepID=UPI0004E19AF5|nr:hypothetical protein [Bryobacter aggregatus]
MREDEDIRWVTVTAIRYLAVEGCIIFWRAVGLYDVADYGMSALAGECFRGYMHEINKGLSIVDQERAQDRLVARFMEGLSRYPDSRKAEQLKEWIVQYWKCADSWARIDDAMHSVLGHAISTKADVASCHGLLDEYRRISKGRLLKWYHWMEPEEIEFQFSETDVENFKGFDMEELEFVLREDTNGLADIHTTIQYWRALEAEGTCAYLLKEIRDLAHVDV